MSESLNNNAAMEIVLNRSVVTANTQSSSLVVTNVYPCDYTLVQDPTLLEYTSDGVSFLMPKRSLKQKLMDNLHYVGLATLLLVAIALICFVFSDSLDYLLPMITAVFIGVIVGAIAGLTSAVLSR